MNNLTKNGAAWGANDLHIWRYISTHRQECANLSIEALGAKCNVSRTTILRFAQKPGLSGFSELRLLLRMECQEKAPAHSPPTSCRRPVTATTK